MDKCLFNVIISIHKIIEEYNDPFSLNKPSAQVIDEEGVKKLIVLPILRCLGWDNFLVLWPEYGMPTGRVDYALGSVLEDVFVECKRGDQDLDTHEGQILRYLSLRPNVEIGVLTNGLEWRFYLSKYMYNKYKGKCNCLNIKGNVKKNCSKFINFLSIDNISSGEAVKNLENLAIKTYNTNFLI